MREGEIGQCAYFVVQGRLLVEKNIDGENVPIAEIGPRDMVGEFAILDDAPRSATVTAMENSVLLVLNKHRIRSLIRRSPAVAEVIMKLLCHKLRKRHPMLKNVNDLDDLAIWQKICWILLLCAKGEDNPAALYRMFSDQLEYILEISTKQVFKVIERLENASAVETQNQRTLCINEDLLRLFVEQCAEEYANIPIETFSETKEYYAAQVILQTLPEISKGKDYIEIPKTDLIQAMMASSLWKDLRPHYQQQRSEAMIHFLLSKEIILASPFLPDNVRVYPKILREIELPEDSLAAYESMKTALLQD